MRVLTMAGFVLLVGSVGPSFSQDIRDQTVVANCSTRPTEWNGKRHACDSQWSEAVAPTGYVFSEATLRGGAWSYQGSEHGCLVEWDRRVEVIPGTHIYQPTVLRVRAHARSMKGHGKPRGWAECKYTVSLTRYAL